MEPTAPNSANTDYEGLELVVEWLKTHSDEGTPLALNDTGSAGPNRVADWPHELISLDAGMFSVSRNEDDELANNPVAAADSAASPRQRIICTHEGCGETFKSIKALRYHEAKHNPAGFHCEQCNYSTWRKDMLQSHHTRRHKQNMDRLKCQKCNYETNHATDLRTHQKRQGHVNETTDTRQ